MIRVMISDREPGIITVPGEVGYFAPELPDGDETAQTPHEAGRSDAGGRTGRPRRGRHHRRRPYVKRGLFIVGVLLIPAVYSYARALTGPGTDSLQARSVEWARDHHLGVVVNRVERYWYDHHQAKVGGVPNPLADQLAIEPTTTSVGQVEPTASRAIGASPGGVSSPAGSSPAGPDSSATAVSAPPGQSSPAGTNPAVPHGTSTPALPAPLTSPASSPIATEGVWHGIGASSNGRYGAYATVIRPDDVHTSVLDAVVWIDPSVLALRQYPGQKIPGAPWDRPDSIETDRQPDLVAAFNGGFRLADSKGGMMLGGTTLSPLRDGAATFVIDQQGIPNIGVWGRDFNSSTPLDSARQNLTLIVDGGVVNPKLALDLNRLWGFTGPANKDAVWRSGAGITADGALVWVGGDGLSVTTLAETLVRAGAIRGMQMDINHEWVQFNTYTADAHGAVHGTRILPAMQHSGDRYLSEDTRDFIAVFRRP